MVVHTACRVVLPVPSSAARILLLLHVSCCCCTYLAAAARILLQQQLLLLPTLQLRNASTCDMTSHIPACVVD
jgi:hypothetical protein